MTGRDTVAIVGVGTTPFRQLYQTRDVQRSAYDLAADQREADSARADVNRPLR